MGRWFSFLVAVDLLVRRAMSWLRGRLLARSPAQGLVEYGLILILIMIVCVGILTTVGRTVSNVWYAKLIRILP